MHFPIDKFQVGLTDGKPLVPVCCVCLEVRALDDKWYHVYSLLPKDILISHTYCPNCAEKKRLDILNANKACTHRGIATAKQLSFL